MNLTRTLDNPLTQKRAMQNWKQVADVLAVVKGAAEADGVPGITHSDRGDTRIVQLDRPASQDNDLRSPFRWNGKAFHNPHYIHGQVELKNGQPTSMHVSDYVHSYVSLNILGRSYRYNQETDDKGRTIEVFTTRGGGGYSDPLNLIPHFILPQPYPSQVTRVDAASQKIVGYHESVSFLSDKAGRIESGGARF